MEANCEEPVMSEAEPGVMDTKSGVTADKDHRRETVKSSDAPTVNDSTVVQKEELTAATGQKLPPEPDLVVKQGVQGNNNVRADLEEVTADTSLIKLDIKNGDDNSKTSNEKRVTSAPSPQRALSLSPGHQLMAQRSASPEELLVMEEIFEPRPSTSRDSGINRLGGASPHSPVSLNATAASSYVTATSKQLTPSPDSKRSQEQQQQQQHDTTEKRQRLKILPRNNQYEKHPLLQIRSESGLSEFDLLLMEKGTSSSTSHPRAFSLEEPITDERSPANPCRRGSNKLVPRGAHYERNMLFEKNEAGLSQLEQYLMEKEQEMTESSSASQETSYTSGLTSHSLTHGTQRDLGGQHSNTTTESGIGTLSESSNVSDASPITSSATGKNNARQRSSSATEGKTHVSLVPALVDIKTESSSAKSRRMLIHSKSVPETSSPPRAALQLQPRVSQYQQHHLLQGKDDRGVSELQSFLQEMDEHYTSEEEKGKCSTKCTCKNVNCSKCKMTSSSLSPSTTPSQTTVTEEVDMVTRIEPKSNNKRVHFQRQECMEVAAAGGDAARQTDRNSPEEGGVSPNGTADGGEELDEAQGSNKTSAKVSKKPKTNKSKCTLS